MDDVANARRQLERCIADTGIPKVNAEIVAAAHEALIRAIVADAVADLAAKAQVQEQASGPAKEHGPSTSEGYDVI